jgi:hypothetical protein
MRYIHRRPAQAQSSNMNEATEKKWAELVCEHLKIKGLYQDDGDPRYHPSSTNVGPILINLC